MYKSKSKRQSRKRVKSRRQSRKRVKSKRQSRKRVKSKRQSRKRVKSKRQSRKRVKSKRQSRKRVKSRRQSRKRVKSRRQSRKYRMLWGLGSFTRDPPEVCLKKDTEKLSKFINFSTGKVKFGIKKPDFKQFCTLCPFPGLNLDESGKLIDIRPVIIVNLTSPSLKPFIGGREDLTYVNQVGNPVEKQAFYLSTGESSDMRGTWLPFDGVSIMETPLGLKTRFEKDNFDRRFGGLFGRMMTKKSEHVFQNLSLVSEILGRGVWGDPERIKKHFEEKYKEYEKLKNKS